MRLALRLTVIGLVACLGYVALGGQASAGEIFTGVGLAVLLAGWCIPDVRGAGDVTQPRGHIARWVTALRQLPVATLRTGWVLARVAIRGGSVGRAVTVPFVHGGVDDPAARSRAATAALAASLAPDSFVVRLPAGRDEAIIHTVVPLPHLPDPMWLG